MKPTTQKIRRVRAERLNRGWSQWEAARRADIPGQMLSNIETGHYAPNPTAPSLRRLADLYGVPAEDLLKLVAVPASVEKMRHAQRGS